MQEFIQFIFNLLSLELGIALISMVPIIELRGAIPIGVSLGMDPLYATIIAFYASLIPAPFIIFFIQKIFDWLSKNEKRERIINKITTRSMDKHQEKIQRYGTIGLIIIVAIPLPGTGVWSGSLIASLLNMKFRYAFPAIILGNLIAALLVMLLTMGIFGFIG